MSLYDFFQKALYATRVSNSTLTEEQKILGSFAAMGIVCVCGLGLVAFLLCLHLASKRVNDVKTDNENESGYTSLNNDTEMKRLSFS